MQNLEAEIRSNEAKWQAYQKRRREDRKFAIEQARRRKELAAIVEAELNEQFNIPAKIRRMSKEYDAL